MARLEASATRHMIRESAHRELDDAVAALFTAIEDGHSPDAKITLYLSPELLKSLVPKEPEEDKAYCPCCGTLKERWELD